MSLLYTCNVCSRSFNRRFNLVRHFREVHDKNRSHTCNTCGRSFTRSSHLREHQLSHSGVRGQSIHIPPPAKVPRLNADVMFTEKHVSRFRNIICLTLRSGLLTNDLWSLYKRVKASLRNEITSHLERLGMLKFDFILKVTFEKICDSDETISCYFHSRALLISATRHIASRILEAFKGLNKQVEDYLERGSGWIIQSIQEFDIHISRYRPIRGSTYLPLPKQIKNKRAVINVKNADNRCFMWAILAALHPVESNPNRLCHYKNHVNDLNFEGIDFPVTLEDIPIFEQLNHISINVYGYTDEEDKITILHLTENRKSERHISLLLYNQQHYCWIKYPERFLRADNIRNHRQFQCHRCLNLFYSIQKRDEHVDKCKNPDLETVEMPDKETIEFENYHKMQRQPYIIYADFECLLEKVDTCLPNPQLSHTTSYQKHTPCAYGLAEIFGCCADSSTLGEVHIYRGEEPVQRFLEQVISLGERYQERYNNQIAAIMSQQDWWEFYGTSVCNICKAPIDADRVLDHCHFCGSYRGACHWDCNIRCRLSRDVVVVIHNLRRYDGHLLLERLGQVLSQRKGVDVFVIPKGFDDYLTFSIKMQYGKVRWSLKFIDSYQFLNAPLAKLVDNLRNKGSDKFTNMASYFTQEQMSYLLRKGVYPYDYIDSWSRFEETQLPQIQEFKSSLTGDDISPADYQHAKDVWSAFKLHNLGEYHDVYLTTDVLLLADVFENFRCFCLYNYQLDPAHYFTSPSFSWDACLKYTGVRLQLLQDPEMYTFLESGIRGGISTITHRYAKANNPLLSDYDPTIPTSFITYLDANNLYGWTMTCPLPLNDFKWLENEIDVTKIADDSETGYILEVDLDYPEALHDIHNDYPLASEHLTVTNDMLSSYCVKLKSLLNVSNATVTKLIPNLYAKQQYIVHYRNLKLYLSLGLKVTKVHRILAFKQTPWMASYIQFNTDMRKIAKSSFEKDLFKLFNNSVFGKTMENVRKYINIKLVCTEDKVIKLASKLNYNGFKVLGESLWAVKLKCDTIKLNKPIYVGFTVLELSKLLMYDFHYNYIIPKYKHNAKLLFTDTDSLCYHITTDDVYRDMYIDNHMFDFSDYPEDHMCYNTANKKVMGKFKDELTSIPAAEFVGLRAKMYSLLDCKGNEKKRAKGVKKSVVARLIRHIMYKNVLLCGNLLKHCMNFIRSDGCNIATVIQNKTSLSAYDDKRYISNDACNTYAYGHKSIKGSR